MCQTFGTVFLLNCIYKTNKFDMPLLNVVGITSTYVTFNAGFTFLHAENEEVYAWVLEQFSKVMTPKVLCTDRELALMNGIAQSFRVATTSFIPSTSTRTFLLITIHAFPMLRGNNLWSNGISLSLARWSNCLMRLLVYSRRPIQEPIQVPGSMLTRHGCLTRRGLLPVTLTSFPTLAALVPQGWKETTTLSSRISVSAFFTSWR